ncbi:MAG: hypothetical protein F4X80_11125, partial [Chloroflexi bacterium]|nr:hypothetical protein [Chloroflexota bacterium]
MPATTTSITLPDLEAGATYEVQVRALTSEEGEGPWSDIGEGRANRPPHTNDWFIVGADVSWGSAKRSPQPLSAYFSDPDGDTLQYPVSSDYPGVVSAAVEVGSGKLFNVFVNPGTAIITYGAQDNYGGYSFRTITVRGVGNETRSVDENSPAGTEVGRSVQGIPYDDGDDETDDSLTHTLHGQAATYFDIDAATGQITVKEGTTLDYETTSSYTGQVKWTVQGQQAVVDLTINVVDLEAGKPDTPTVTRTEFSEQSNPALDVTWTKPADNGLTISWYKVQYRKQAAAGEQPAAWTLHSAALETTSLTLSDLEAGAVYEFQVRAGTNEEGLGPWSDTGSGRANRPPHHASYGGVYYFYVNGPGPGGLAVGDDWVSNPIGLFFADSDGDTLTWGVSSQYPGIGDVGGFELRERPSDITFLPDEKTLRWTFEFYNPASLVLTYGAHDGYGGYTQRTFTWTGTQTETRAIAENSAAGTAVGDPVTGTPYDDGDDATDDALTYTLTGEAATSGAFVIDSASGQISVQEDANLDYETKSSYTGSVTWTVQGQTATASLTINVTDVEAGKPDAPSVTRTAFSKPSNPALDVSWTAPAANGLTITGYNAQYRKQVADGETANEWTDYTITG